MTQDDTEAWTVTGQIPQVKAGADGRFTEGVTVSFTTRSGARGDVFVPQDQYSVATVRRMISERASVMDAVAALRG